MENKRLLRYTLDIEVKKLSGHDRILSAWKQSVLFCEGSVLLGLINRTLFDLGVHTDQTRYKAKDYIRIPISNPYVGQGPSTTIDYKKLQVVQESDYSVVIHPKYFMDALAHSKECSPLEVAIDSSNFLCDICEAVREYIKYAG